MKTIKEMKAKLQAKKKDNKGFSLVELIIVIAIMAILVGIIASQVIPYMEKSRESKDISFLDTCLTSLQTAYADNELSTSITGATLNDLVSGNITPAVSGAEQTRVKKAGEDIARLLGVSTTDKLSDKLASDKGKNGLVAGSDNVKFNVVKGADGRATLGISCGALGVSTANGASK